MNYLAVKNLIFLVIFITVLNVFGFVKARSAACFFFFKVLVNLKG